MSSCQSESRFAANITTVPSAPCYHTCTCLASLILLPEYDYYFLIVQTLIVLQAFGIVEAKEFIEGPVTSIVIEYPTANDAKVASIHGEL